MGKTRHGHLVLLALAAGLPGCDNERTVEMSQYVRMYPSAAIVMFSRDSTTLTVTVRNVCEKKLTDLRLEVKSEACTAGVIPRSLPAIIPGDRRNFAVTLTRVEGKERKRYPLLLTLRSPDLPLPAGLDLMVDLNKPVDGNWIDVGQVTLVAQEGTRTVYYLLAGVPMVFLLGWMLWRWSRPKEEDEASARDEDEASATEKGEASATEEDEASATEKGEASARKKGEGRS